MKKILVLLVCLFSFSVVMAADEKFVKAVESALVAMRNSKTIDEYQNAANTMERIAAAEPKEWLPAYWASFCYTMMSFMEKDNNRKDQLLDKADAMIAKAEAIATINDEIVVMQAFAAQARMVVDPQSRWGSYGMKANELLGKAKAMNPENPRLYFLQAQSLYNTPEQFGGGPKVACPVFNTAMQKFEAFSAASSIHPNWGKERTAAFVEKCK